MGRAADAEAAPMRRMQELVDELGRTIDRPILVEDRALNLVAYSRHRGDEVDRVRRETILRRAAPPDAKAAVLAQGIETASDLIRIQAAPEIGLGERLCVPISAQGEQLGYLWLIDAVDELGDAQVEAARTVAADLARLMAPAATAAVDEGELIDDLLAADEERRAAAARRLQERGLQPAAAVVLAVVPAAPDEGLGRFAGLPARLSRGQAAIGTRRGRALAILAVEDPAFADHSAGAATRWLAGVAGRGPLGVSDVGPLAAAAELLRQAELALGHAEADAGGAVCWPELGVDRILDQLPAAALAEVPAGLRRLLAEDEPLALTLRAFLDCAGDVKLTAERLSLHRSGVYYRLHRIEELSGLDLGRGDDRLLAHIAVRTRHL